MLLPHDERGSIERRRRNACKWRDLPAYGGKGIFISLGFSGDTKSYRGILNHIGGFFFEGGNAYPPTTSSFNASMPSFTLR